MEEHMIRVLITGATGQQGGAVARALIDRGHHVRALSRDPESSKAYKLRRLGAENVKGNFNDVESLKAAADGVDAVFVMGTPFELGTEKETTQGIAAVDAFNAAGVKHIVYTSVADADRDTGIPHFDSKYRVEQHIRELGLPHTIVAPVFFFDNMYAPFMLDALKQGTLAMGLPPDRKLQSVAVENIGAFTAHVIENRDDFLGKRVNIASDELSGQEYASVLSRVSGSPISYYPVPLEQIREGSEDMALMYEWFDRVGYSADIEGLRTSYPDVGWLRFEEWAQKSDWKVLDKAS
jgi:uncharacterized protein YbjT (DUF2867 family)